MKGKVWSHPQCDGHKAGNSENLIILCFLFCCCFSFHFFYFYFLSTCSGLLCVSRGEGGQRLVFRPYHQIIAILMISQGRGGLCCEGLRVRCCAAVRGWWGGTAGSLCLSKC